MDKRPFQHLLNNKPLIDEMNRYYGVQEEGDYLPLLLMTYLSNAKSPVRGTRIEMAHEIKGHKSGILVEKVKDGDTSKRYDHLVLSDTKESEIEIRTATPKGRVSLSFRDSRKVILPSGNVWTTHARHIDEGFDFLGASMVNVTKDFQDFAYLHKSNFPKMKIDKKTLKFSEKDQKHIQDNYYAPKRESFLAN